LIVPLPIVGAYALGIVLILLLGFFLVIPLKIVFRLVYNGLIGGIVLWLVNLVGVSFGFVLPITVWTALLVGFFGLPGVAVLLFYFVFMAGRPM
jgi:inhibitor of the pro-sigma K processing machinery